MPVGTRVCCYWSSQLSFLYPGTVTAVSASGGEQLVTVRLDDGDERSVHVDSVRLLPADYPLVEAGAGGTDDTVENSTLSSLTVQVEFFFSVLRIHEVLVPVSAD
jgi:hypothetical protein